MIRKGYLYILLIIFIIYFTPAVNSMEFDLPGLGNTGFSFTESAIYRYFSDDTYVEDYEEGEDYEFINRLNLRITKGDYIIGLRFDVDINTTREEEYRFLLVHLRPCQLVQE